MGIHICQQGFNLATPFVNLDPEFGPYPAHTQRSRLPFLRFASIRISYLECCFHLSVHPFVISNGELSRVWICLVFLRYAVHIYTGSVKRIYKCLQFAAMIRGDEISAS